MSAVGAPLGNNNRAKGKMFRSALKRALVKKHGSLIAGLDAAAEILREDAIDKKNVDSVVEIADRIDVKAPTQPATVQVAVNLVVVTSEMLQGLDRDELLTLRAAYPVLKKLGLVGDAGPGAAPAGEPG